MILKHSNFFESIDQLRSVVSELEFVEDMYGLEVKDFNYLPDNITEHIQNILNMPIKISANSGKFRKPYPVIHFEDFNENRKLVLAVALEETTFKTYKHADGHETVFSIDNMPEFIKSELNKHKWIVIDEITLRPNEFIVFNPWTWHSFDEKIIQVFYLEISNAV